VKLTRVNQFTGGDLILIVNLSALIPFRLAEVAEDRRGVTSIEYGLIAVIIILAVMGGLGIIGGELAKSFNDVASEL
jgi:pilus assembly protein Flp/PilA